jgi:uncharacterized protein (TIGR03435 family)
LITSAYNLQPYQLNGPSWLWSEFAEVNATFPLRTTLEHYRQMLANLLVERFGLKFHNVPKSFSGFEIALERGGPSSAMKSSPEKADNNGAVFDGRNNGVGVMHYTFTQTSMNLMRNRLMLMLMPMNPVMGLGRPDFSPVEDRTGLSGKFDFELDVASPPFPESGQTPEQFNDSVSNVADALRNQLGLRLKRTKIELPVLVVDRILKIPSPN